MRFNNTYFINVNLNDPDEAKRATLAHLFNRFNAPGIQRKFKVEIFAAEISLVSVNHTRQ